MRYILYKCLVRMLKYLKGTSFLAMKTYKNTSKTKILYEVVHYFGRSDDEMISEKMLILKICRGSGLMPNLIKKILDGI